MIGGSIEDRRLEDTCIHTTTRTDVVLPPRAATHTPAERVRRERSTAAIS